MSCGNPTTDPDALMQRRKKYDKTKNCVRCKEALGNLVIRHAVYCKKCFVPLITHKFRRSLEPHVNPKADGPRKTALKPSGNLLIGFSGGLGSSVLLDLVHRCYVSLDKATMPSDGGRDHPRHDRVWKKITVCYVEVCDAFPGMKDHSEEVAQFVARYEDIELVTLRIRDAFDRSWWEKVGGMAACSGHGIVLSNESLPIESLADTNFDPLTALHAYLSSLPTPTAVHSSVQTLIRLLLLHTAAQTDSSHLVLGTSLTSLAVSLISGVAQGSGFTVREESFEEWHPPDSEAASHSQHLEDDGVERTAKKIKNAKKTVRVVRPLRDIGMKECAAWAWWSHIPVVGKEKWLWPGAKPGISTLTKDFIVGLEQDYPSTVSTIVRTCAKLAPKGSVRGACALCGRPVQEGVQEWKARISIRSPPSSTNASSPTSEAVPPPDPDPHSHDASLTPLLCYPCHTTLTSRSARPAPSLWRGAAPAGGDATPLPVWTEARVAAVTSTYAGEVLRTKAMSREEMKEAVSGFLLDE